LNLRDLTKLSLTGPDLDSLVDPRFGRCQYFLIVDSADMSFEAVPNTNLSLGGGVGIQSGKMVADSGAKVVLTGNMGPNAYQVLSAAGLDVITGVSGTVREAVDQYKQGKFGAARQANVSDHFGRGAARQGAQFTGPSRGSFPAFGTGRGMGRGIGRRAVGPRMDVPAQAIMPEETADLKETVRSLRRQVEEMQKRLKQLESKKE